MRDPDLQHVDDVGVAGQAAHRPALAEEPLTADGVEVGVQQLHRHRAVQRLLGAAEDRPETTAADLDGVGEPGTGEVDDDGGPPTPGGIGIRHRGSAVFRRGRAHLGQRDRATVESSSEASCGDAPAASRLPTSRDPACDRREQCDANVTSTSSPKTQSTPTGLRRLTTASKQ